MRIGIVGPINPSEFEDLLHKDEIPQMHQNASAVHALINSFLDEGHTVIAFTINENNIYEEFVSEKLKIYTVPFRLIPRTSIFKIYCVKQLRRAIKNHLQDIDVLHAQWTYEYAFAAMAFVKRIPVFCTVRDWCPYIMTMIRKSFTGCLGWKINYYMFRRIMACKDIHLIANSQYTYSRIKSFYPERESVILPNSIKKNFIIVHRGKINEQIKLISIANGIFDPRKNIITLLKAFKQFRIRHPDAVLTIVGKYKEEDFHIIQWKAEGLLENVITTGQLSHDEVIAKIDQSTMLIHPSLEETFGNILLEAMARRIPIIGGIKSGAVPMVLGEGKYGLCCDITSPEEITKAMEELLDKRKAVSLVNAATKHLLSTYASDVVCKKHIETYTTLMKNLPKN